MDKKRFFGGSGDLFLFRENALMIVAAVVSLLLQIISFFTTLDGAQAYFGATFAYAPLLFAVAVQSVVYFLENGLRRRVTFMKLTALTLAICCSSYFSFVGIYNNVNPPSQYLERTYNSYVKELEAIRESKLSEDTGEFTLASGNAVNYIISEYTMLTSERETLEKLSEEISSAEAEAVYGMTAPRRSEYETYEEYAAAYSAYIAGFSQSSTAEQQAKLEALLNKYGIDDTSEIGERTAELTARISLIEGTMASFGGTTFYQRAETMRAQVSRGIKTAISQLSSLYMSLSGKSAEIPEYISADSIELQLPEYAEIAGDSVPSVVRERLSSTVSAACDVLLSAGCGVSSADYEFENIYTLPIYAVLSGDFGADAAVSLLLAVLVDVLSLLFAMIFVRGRSALSAKNTEQAVIGDNMLFERNIAVAVRLGMCAEGRRYSDTPDFDEIADRLGDFVSRFRAVDLASEKGYTMAADREALRDYEPLVAFLCQFGLAKVLSAEEMSLLSGGETGEAVLLKTKFILWLSEKTELDSKKNAVKPSEKAVTA